MLHDVTHVVFGCDTSVRGEALLDTWTVFGSSVPFREYLGFLKFPETHMIAREAGGYPMIALIGLVNLPDLVRALFRARRMTRRWPWRGFEKHLDRPLVEIRAEFNIRVIP